jgi:hypothetical protein
MALERLERHMAKVIRAVLRGGGDSNVASLPAKKVKNVRSLSPPSGKGECHENNSLSFRCSDSRFFDAAGDGFLVIPRFYRKVVNVPGPGTIESYGVIGGDI